MKSRYLLCQYLHNQFPRTNDIKKQMKELNCDLYGFYPRKKIKKCHGFLFLIYTNNKDNFYAKVAFNTYGKKLMHPFCISIKEFTNGRSKK